MTLAVTPRNLVVLSAVFLLCAAVFGVLNANKVKFLRSSAVDAVAAREGAERRREAREKELQAQETALAAARAKISDMESKAAQAEAELMRIQTDEIKRKLRLQASEDKIAELQRPIEETTTRSSPNPGAPSGIELQAPLEVAENENALLADKVHASGEHSQPLKQDTKRQTAVRGKARVRGTILAVNHAYNFVVLNLGKRHGLEANAEMLVMRGGTLIGKIRVSSVEPSTAIGDMITGSLARSVQVQPGDIVVYAGTF